MGQITLLKAYFRVCIGPPYSIVALECRVTIWGSGITLFSVWIFLGLLMGKLPLRTLTEIWLGNNFRFKGRENCHFTPDTWLADWIRNRTKSKHKAPVYFWGSVNTNKTFSCIIPSRLNHIIWMDCIEITREDTKRGVNEKRKDDKQEPI